MGEAETTTAAVIATVVPLKLQCNTRLEMGKDEKKWEKYQKAQSAAAASRPNKKDLSMILLDV